MIGAEQLDALRDGATIINTARGKLIDTNALIEALEDDQLAPVAAQALSGTLLLFDLGIDGAHDGHRASQVTGVARLLEEQLRLQLGLLRGDLRKSIPDAPELGLQLGDGFPAVGGADEGILDVDDSHLGRRRLAMGHRNQTQAEGREQ